MKKIYSTLSMLVAGAIVASAASIMDNATFFQPNPIKQIKENFQPTSNKTTVRHDVKARAEGEISIGGTYINTYNPIFQGFLDLEQNSILEIKADGDQVFFPGLCEWSQANASSAWERDIAGTRVDNTIVVSAGQVVGVYTSDGTPYNCTLYVYDDKKGWSDEADAIFTITEDGSLICEGAFLLLVGDLNDNIGGWGGQDGASIYRPNATIEYDSWYFKNLYDDEALEKVSLPMYVEYIPGEDGASDEIYMTSPKGSGYVIQPVVEDGEVFMNTINSDTSGDYQFMYSAGYGLKTEEGVKRTGFGFDWSGSINEDKSVITWPTSTIEIESLGEVQLNIWASTSEPDAEGSYYIQNYIYGPATISMNAAGVENVNADKANNANAPVEFFNLQGQRVINPEAGQLVIRRQGSDVTKMIVR